MRVIAGEAKGFPLKSPPGRGTRPTSDLVRGVIFAMLETLVTDWSRVLDLYAGTGALGIEALSRGADWVDFVEASRPVCGVIRENLARTGFAVRAKVYCVKVRQALSLLEGRYAIILADPPYGDPETEQVIAALAASSLVGPGTVLVVEHSRRLVLAPEYGRLQLAKNRRHGDTAVSIYQVVEEER